MMEFKPCLKNVGGDRSFATAAEVLEFSKKHSRDQKKLDEES